MSYHGNFAMCIKYLQTKGFVVLSKATYDELKSKGDKKNGL